MKKLQNICIALLFISFINCSEDSTVSGTEFGTITGKVVEEGTFTPIENSKISLSPSNNTVFTDANGDFILEEIPVNEYSVEAEKDGFLNAFEPVSLEAGSSVNVVFEMKKETALNRPPTTPELLTPTDGAADLPNSVELTWSSTDPDEDTLTYTIELKNDVNNDVILIEDVKEALYTITNLKYGIKYFWQVTASDGINNKVYSATNSFEITNIPENRFFFVREEQGNNVIYSAGFENNEPVNELLLTQSTFNSWRPRKNSVTNLIAFLRTSQNETHLFTMNPDGSDVKKVTSSVSLASFNLNELDFSWSSNGDKIIYPHYDKLYVINKDGSGLQELYQTNDGNYITECDWSNDGTKIALKTNNIRGYNAKIFTIDMNGNIEDIVLTGMQGAAGGINFSIDGNKLLYTRDVSNFESNDYRQLDNAIFIYDFSNGNSTSLSTNKSSGTNDLDPRFSPNESEVIFVNTSNDGFSTKTIYKTTIAGENSIRTDIFTNATMPDWE